MFIGQVYNLPILLQSRRKSLKIDSEKNLCVEVGSADSGTKLQPSTRVLSRFLEPVRHPDSIKWSPYHSLIKLNMLKMRWEKNQKKMYSSWCVYANAYKYVLLWKNWKAVHFLIHKNCMSLSPMDVFKLSIEKCFLQKKKKKSSMKMMRNLLHKENVQGNFFLLQIERNSFERRKKERL